MKNLFLLALIAFFSYFFTNSVHSQTPQFRMIYPENPQLKVHKEFGYLLCSFTVSGLNYPQKVDTKISFIHENGTKVAFPVAEKNATYGDFNPDIITTLTPKNYNRPVIISFFLTYSIYEDLYNVLDTVVYKADLSVGDSTFSYTGQFIWIPEPNIINMCCVRISKERDATGWKQYITAHAESTGDPVKSSEIQWKNLQDFDSLFAVYAQIVKITESENYDLSRYDMGSGVDYWGFPCLSKRDLKRYEKEYKAQHKRKNLTPMDMLNHARMYFLISRFHSYERKVLEGGGTIIVEKADAQSGQPYFLTYEISKGELLLEK